MHISKPNCMYEYLNSQTGKKKIMIKVQYFLDLRNNGDRENYRKNYNLNTKKCFMKKNLGKSMDKFILKKIKDQ